MATQSVSRTGWTGEVGYEIYLRDGSRGDDLWEQVMEAGRPHGKVSSAPRNTTGAWTGGGSKSPLKW